MNFSDFEYADEMLSDYGGMVCSFSDSNGAENSVLSHLTINTVKNMNSYKKKIVSHSYDDTYSFSMEICKNESTEKRYFTESEAMEIINWLGRKEYLKFKPIYNEVAAENKLDIYYLDSDSMDSTEHSKILSSGLKIPGTCTESGEEQPLSSSFGTPLTLFTKKGKVIGCISGYVAKDGLLSKLKSVGMLK